MESRVDMYQWRRSTWLILKRERERAEKRWRSDKAQRIGRSTIGPGARDLGWCNNRHRVWFGPGPV